jgi:signal peptidase I
MALPRAVRRSKSTVREYAEALVVALLLALAIRTFVVQAFKIPSGSMLPTLEIGDHILVNKFLYGPRLEIPFTQVSLGQLPGLRAPEAGDVVVFVWPKDRSKDFIKRVIAVGGQSIELRGREIWVDGHRWEDPYGHYEPGRARPLASVGGWLPTGRPRVIPPGTVFVMGDNRDQSYDSRVWGPVDVADIKGKALIIYWSWTDGWRVRWGRLGRLVE